jgi:hypothetical protein
VPQVSRDARRRLQAAIAVSLTKQDLIELFDYELEIQLGNIVNLHDAQGFSSIVYHVLTWLNRNDKFWVPFLEGIILTHYAKESLVKVVQSVQHELSMGPKIYELNRMVDLDTRAKLKQDLMQALQPILHLKFEQFVREILRLSIEILEEKSRGLT